DDAALDRNLSSCGVVDGVREDGRIRSGGAFLEGGTRELLHALHRPDAGADDRADARAVVLVDLDARVLERELRADQREEADSVHALALFRREILRRIEVDAPDERPA